MNQASRVKHNGRSSKRSPRGAYAELKALIQGGHFPPGSFLSERQLSQQLGMSKTPIRAALEHLEAQGLVKISPQQGIVVRDLSLREAVESFELRYVLEPHVARRLAGRLSAPQRQRLQADLEQQRVAAERGDAELCAQLDLGFHLLLCEFLDNQEILQVTKRALDKLYRTILLVHVQLLKQLTASAREHASVAEAIIEGDGEAAARRMEDHLQFVRQFLSTRT
jgi:DNA-binding GntR family transcriptional regulator